MAYGRGALSQTVGDCTTAVRHYEDTIALQGLHEDAAMQRAICLGHIGQFVPAIEGATRIIERRYYNTTDAYYWRAWNRHRRKELPMARADIDQARSMSVNVQVLTLGGVIKYDQNDLELAESDLTEAVRIDPTQCLAWWYFGLVQFKKETWPETAKRFIDSAACYKRSVDESVSKLEEMRASDLDADFKASQIAGFEAVIKEDRDQEQASNLNAANSFARAGDVPSALDWLQKIPADSIHAAMAAELRRLIGGDVPPPAEMSS